MIYEVYFANRTLTNKHLTRGREGLFKQTINVME